MNSYTITIITIVTTWHGFKSVLKTTLVWQKVPIHLHMKYIAVKREAILSGGFAWASYVDANADSALNIAALWPWKIYSIRDLYLF